MYVPLNIILMLLLPCHIVAVRLTALYHDKNLIISSNNYYYYYV